ncbi:acetyl-CoA carboxylase biotin carboxylase subunit family protein [Thermoactinomyces sp. DSM 45892]|uniref:ATP-grasp domain-containing protein n=1 Tax=Thermoactinomyces sp. DSM 45892 TaxID=1882753 RepID=UPI0008991436|nr:hypothetical protein [Thermoactinomyces sp. DSM 45892]SDY10681.1 hypothetical protein SAMN05444416_10220 [Thermoactinomyces sp. DSM 45892]
MAYIFLFPSSYQVKILEKLAQQYQKDIVILSSEKNVHLSDQILTLLDHQFIEWVKERQNDTWFCCHEQAVYFASLHRQFVNHICFEPICLDMLTKSDMGRVLEEIGVPILPKKLLKEFNELEDLPMVVKPNFGFASTLVKRITSKQELEKYMTEYIQYRHGSLVETYQEAYFHNNDPQLLEEIMFEPDISTGTFLSVPFIASPDGLIASFPVVGSKRVQTKVSHFVWTEFHAPDHLPSEIRNRIDQVLDKLSTSFARCPSVFHAEIILDPQDGTPWVLEFSPRITGGNIPRLIYYAYGIDLDTYTLELALGMNLKPIDRYNMEDVIMISRKEGENISNYGTVLESFHKIMDGVCHTQEIRYLS